MRTIALRTSTFAFAIAGIASMMSAGCGMGDDAGAEMNHNQNWSPGTDAGTHWECFSSNDCPPGQYCNEFHQCVSPPATDGGTDGEVYQPPETEKEFSPPATGSRFVYVALSAQDVVVRIDSESLEVTSLPVGDRPTTLATAAGQDLAVVINSGSDSVSILRTADGDDTITTLDTPPHLNRLAISPLGGFAVAYFELDHPDTQDIGSFQDVSLIRLQPGEEAVYNVTVGFRPRRVVFTPDESAAFVITEDGVSILDLADLTAGFVAPTVPVSSDPIDEGMPDEVVVSPFGFRAFARWSFLPAVRTVDLVTEELVDTPLSGPPTDIDLTADGSRLVAVVRDTSKVQILDVPDDIGDASAVDTIDCTPLAVGSAVLTQDGAGALVFTNATNEEVISHVDLSTGELEPVLLKKGVRTVALSPDGENALVLHNKLPGDPADANDFETQIDRRYGFSILHLGSMFAKLQLTEADPGGFAFMPDSSSAYLIVADPNMSLRNVLGLDLSNLIVTPFVMGSHPTEVGVLPGTQRVYVSQEHSMGRVSFINVETEEVRTVTGFQLNSQITE